MPRKLDTVHAMLHGGFALDAIDSDEGTLDVRMSQGQARVTIRFGPEEMPALWRALFPPRSGTSGKSPSRPDGPTAARGVTGVTDSPAGPAGPTAPLLQDALLLPVPHGLAEVAEFLRRDAADRGGRDDRGRGDDRADER